MNIDCPVCIAPNSSAPFREVDGYPYYSCGVCSSIFIEPEVLLAMDQGSSPREYDEDYWLSEQEAAQQRAHTVGLVRFGEAMLYARREVRKFLDVGAGPGLLLDQFAKWFPDHAEMFHAVEMFPPDERSSHPNYTIGNVSDLQQKFDAGVCIEVVEHLTPRMLDQLVAGLATVSAKDSLWLFNTGMPELVKHEDPGYLDPRRRGHIVSYGFDGLRKLFEPHGFRLSELPGMSFAFIAEYSPSAEPMLMNERFYNPIPANKQLLEAAGILYSAAFESARSYFFQAESLNRAKWAQSLQAELELSRADCAQRLQATGRTRQTEPSIVEGSGYFKRLKALFR